MLAEPDGGEGRNAGDTRAGSLVFFFIADIPTVEPRPGVLVTTPEFKRASGLQLQVSVCSGDEEVVASISEVRQVSR